MLPCPPGSSEISATSPSPAALTGVPKPRRHSRCPLGLAGLYCQVTLPPTGAQMAAGRGDVFAEIGRGGRFDRRDILLGKRLGRSAH